MSCLDATFTLTPLSPIYLDPHDARNSAFVECYGADFWASAESNLSSDCANNRFFFDGNYASDPTPNYAQFVNRQKAKFLVCGISLTGYAGANKQLVLIFGFDVESSVVPGRVLVYNDSIKLKDQQLAYGDNQFVFEIDSLDQPFYHAGGWWFFRGLSGYVI